eukprot:m.77336 g.77336  ORF g.77336 m.77336 type:complete len:688 (-) comp10604_c0_seq3:132-2195(-)
MAEPPLFAKQVELDAKQLVASITAAVETVHKRTLEISTAEFESAARIEEQRSEAAKAAADEKQAIADERAMLEAAREKSRVEVQKFSDRVTLQFCQEGQRFITSRRTLCPDPENPDNMLAVIFSGRAPMPIETTDDGAVFIDRDGEHFKHILQYLRQGYVTVDPGSRVAKELAVEAEYYGMGNLTRLLRAQLFDVETVLGPAIVRDREREAEIRAWFQQAVKARESSAAAAAADQSDAASGSGADTEKTSESAAASDAWTPGMHEGLVSIFEEDGVLEDVNEWVPDPMGHQVLMERPHTAAKRHLRMLVHSLESFTRVFNQRQPNVLHRLQAVLQEEPVLIAGGSVLQALTAADGLRLAEHFTNHPDVDIFVCTTSPTEATRIAQRIYFSLAVDDERWVITRGSGVINIEQLTTTDWSASPASVLQQIQVVLRLYDSPAEVLLGFDVDCACLGFDGDRVWALPRALRALKHNINVLNPLHAWPLRASYEYRLCKYALRGYAIAVPGLEQMKIDIGRIAATPLDKSRGLARLLRLVLAITGRHPASAWEPLTTLSSVHPGLKSLFSLVHDALGEHECLNLKFGIGSTYDDEPDALRDKVVIYPSVFNNDVNVVYEAFYRGDVFAVEEFVLMAMFTRTEAWAEINDSPDAELKIPRRLDDAWDRSKRSREAINADEPDREARYYATAST